MPRTELSQINLTFQKYYSKLYESECKCSSKEDDDVFNRLTLKETETEYLERSVLESEVKATIKMLASGKALGEDGYNTEFHHLYGHEFKVDLYVDDILLTISNPGNLIPQLLKPLNDFGQLSGCKVNWSK